MATTFEWLEYTIHLTDRAQVEALQQAPSKIHAAGFLPNPELAPSLWPESLYIGYTVNNGYLYASPSRAAALYNAPVQAKDTPFAAPCCRSSWISNVAQQNFPVDVDVTTRKSGGWFGIHALFGDTHYFAWRGTFVYSPPSDPTRDGTPVPTPNVISRRRWVDGFELPLQGEGGSGLQARSVNRLASRHADGYGFNFTESDASKTHPWDEYAAPDDQTTHWDRFYMRLTKKPDSTVAIYRTHGATSSSAGVEIAINSSGKVLVYNVSNADAETLVATSAAQGPTNNGVLPMADLAAGTGWLKVDVLVKYAPTARLRIYINGEEWFDITSFPASGLGQAQDGASSQLGGVRASASTAKIGLHFDDWSGMDQPSTLDGLDWLNGSKLVRVNPKAFAGANAWAGDVRALVQNPASDFLPSVTSSSSGARLEVETDAEATADAAINSLGCVALVVGKFGTRGAGASGQLGYSIAGAAEVLAAITENTVAQWNSVLFAPEDQTQPTPITPLNLIHTKGATTNAAAAENLSAVAELLGVFGPEDIMPEDTDVSTVRAHTGIHNAPYPNTPWATRGKPPISPVAIVGGIYTGNDVGQDVNLNFPPCFVWVRRVASNGPGTLWWSSHVSAHPFTQQRTRPAHLVIAELDPTFVSSHAEDTQEQRYRIRIVGEEVQSNEDGIDYQYIAFCDPGMRFALNAALLHHRGTTDRTTKLVNTNMRAEAAFVHRENVGGASDTEVWFKGRGHAAQSISQLASAETADAFGVGTGEVTSRSAIHADNTQFALALFRREDGSTDPGVPRVVQIFSYVGDGASPRTIDFERESGRRPLFALIVGHDGACVTRDPSNTGTESNDVGAAGSLSTNSTDGIRGGDIDQIIVGSDLNDNGVTYDVFLFPGSDVAGNNGWSGNGEFIPVEPAPPVDGPWELPPDDPGGETPPDDGGGGGDGQGPTDPPGDDFGDQCVDASTKVFNQALSKVGVTQRVLDIVNDEGVEADQGRLHYADAVIEVLRDFPWPFATRYANLVLVDGTPEVPTNGDWIYAFRAPANMAAPRRIVREGTGRKFDENPIPWRLGSDSDGYLIYCNEIRDDDTIELEYTFRAQCAASLGDALFRDALAWKCGEKISPGLSRDQKTVDRCIAGYLRVVSVAAARAAREKQEEDTGGDAPWIRGR